MSAKMRENRLTKFVHMKKKNCDAHMRSRGRSKITVEEHIKIDLHELHLFKDLIRSRSSCRNRIQALDF